MHYRIKYLTELYKLISSVFYCLICSAPDVPSKPTFAFLILKLLQMDSFVVVLVVKSNCHKNVSSFSLQIWHFFSEAIGLEAKAVEESVLDH